MRSTQERPLTNVATHIRAAWPRHTRKSVQRELSVSDSQADRIVKTGRVPGKFRAALLSAVHNAIASNQRELERLGAELKAIRHARMVDRASSGRAQAMGTGAGMAARQAERPADAAVSTEVGPTVRPK